LGGDGKPSREVPGPLEWKIVGVGNGMGNNMWLTTDTAIRYVTQISEKTKDAVIKQNAAKTITQLKRLLR